MIIYYFSLKTFLRSFISNDIFMWLFELNICRHFLQGNLHFIYNGKTNWLPFLWDKIFMDEIQVWLKCFIDQWNPNIYRHLFRHTSTSKTMSKSSWLPLRLILNEKIQVCLKCFIDLWNPNEKMFILATFRFAWTVSYIIETQKMNWFMLILA